jgi:hypothetical protein
MAGGATANIPVMHRPAYWRIEKEERLAALGLSAAPNLPEKRAEPVWRF